MNLIIIIKMISLMIEVIISVYYYLYFFANSYFILSLSIFLQFQFSKNSFIKKILPLISFL